MKKTIITLLTLAGVAAAADEYKTTEYNSLLSSTDGWSAYSNGSTATVSSYLTTTSGTFNGPNNWTNPSIKYAFDTPLTLAAGATLAQLEFSYTFAVGSNAAATLTFVTDSMAIVTGSGWYDGAGNANGHTAGFGTTTDTSANFYNFKDTDTGKKVAKTDNYTMVYDYESGSKTLTVEGSIKYSDAGYILSMTCGDSAAQTLNLGQSLNINSIILSGNGGGGSSISGVEISHTALIPEPTTATLSLLALAGLAARRRRK